MTKRVLALLLISVLTSSLAGAVTTVNQKPDPYGSPRPAKGQQNVPLQTSFFIELTPDIDAQDDAVNPETVAINLKPIDGKEISILEPGRKSGAGFTIKFHDPTKKGDALSIYADSKKELMPATTYTVTVRAQSQKGISIDEKSASWQFRTEEKPSTHNISFDLDIKNSPVEWKGAFFNGFCKPSFCTSYGNRLADYELMSEARKQFPKAWSVQRDWWITGFEHSMGWLSMGQPNIVREKETRRIKEIKDEGDRTRLIVEDFFGHEQYDIPSNRPVSEDYHAGDEVLIADGENSTRTIVVAADDQTKSVLVKAIKAPEAGWKIEYTGPLPQQENPNAPGLFPPNGCYLRKFNPVGTPHYYWGRVDKEEDLVHQKHGRRLHVNFCDGPGDLSVDGQDWTIPKDYAQYHEVVRVITSRFIERYGEACLDFVWAVLNEPDLGSAFWRADWKELQKFYDYTADGILRAFEDHGYDSSKVFIGGLELGAIFGKNLRAWEFLAHCSPVSTTLTNGYINKVVQEGTVHYNAAFADKRLDGKRSKRVESLCSASNGKGSPINFLSVHTYNGSEMAATKMILAKDMALEVNPEYYANLWINTHESCPTWTGSPDLAINDGYSGNGFFATWIADVSGRLLRKAQEDKRYAYGESILTFWPWQDNNFNSMNDCFRVIHIDKDGDGREDQALTIPKPEFHFLNLLNSMGNNYWVLPEEKIGGHSVTGFASKTDKDLRVLLYSHFGQDPQSRSNAEYAVELNLAATNWKKARITEYRFDKDNNSYYHLLRALRDKPIAAAKPTTKLSDKEISNLKTMLESSDSKQQIKALKRIEASGSNAPELAFSAMVLAKLSDNAEVKSLVGKLSKRYEQRNQGYAAKDVLPVIEKSALSCTGTQQVSVGNDGKCSINVKLAANGANFLVISED